MHVHSYHAITTCAIMYKYSYHIFKEFAQVSGYLQLVYLSNLTYYLE